MSQETKDERGPTDDLDFEEEAFGEIAEGILLFLSVLAILLFLATH